MNESHAVASTTEPRVPWRYRLAAKLVIASLQRWSAGGLAMTLPDGRELLLGDHGDARRVAVRITDWKFFWRVLIAGDIGVGESYVAGEWTCSDLPELCRRFLHDQTVVRYRSSLWTIPARLYHWLLWRRQANTLAGSRRNIHHHYDLGNELYRLFLDESMMYSCAVFPREDTSLEEAQAHKLDAICRRLELRPGMEILEIGCGWGAFAMHAARYYGCRVTGLTLSTAQLQLARQRIAEAGLDAMIDLRLTDYRQMDGQFDRIVSIEMFEAVGYEYYGAYFGTCGRLLKPGGRMFLQTISVPDQRFDTYRHDFDWIKKYIFPGGLLASLHAIAATLKEQTDLRIDWMQDIGLHYARTLRCWRQRFMSRVPEVQSLGFDECFVRMWEFYLASCEAAFSVHYIGDLQMVLAKPA